MVFSTVPKVQDTVKILLMKIIKNNEFIPILGVRQSIIAIRNAESQKLNTRRNVCLPNPFKIPQETESANIMGEKSAIMHTVFEI